MKRSPIQRKTRLKPISKRMRSLIPIDQRYRAENLVMYETPCVRCFEVHGFLRNAVEEHHVRTRRIPSTRHAKSNRAPLCKECHDYAGAHGKAFREWWDQR